MDVADVHPGAFAHSFEPLEGGDAVLVVALLAVVAGRADGGGIDHGWNTSIQRPLEARGLLDRASAPLPWGSRGRASLVEQGPRFRVLVTIAVPRAAFLTPAASRLCKKTLRP